MIRRRTFSGIAIGVKMWYTDVWERDPEFCNDGGYAVENRVQINTSLSLSVDMIGSLECEPGRVGKEHTHHFWEIILITRDFSDFKALLVCPNEPHSFNNDLGEVAHMLYIGFRFNENTDPGSARRGIQEKLNKRENFEKYAAFFDSMQVYGVRGGASLLAQVFLFLTGILSEYMTAGEGDEQHSIVSEIKKYIAVNLDRPLTVREIASTLYLSPKYIGNVFRKKTGMGILQYQKAKKMERAMVYLKSGEYSVGEVASLVGFENVAYFSNTFKEYYGLSPVNFVGTQDGKNL